MSQSSYYRIEDGVLIAYSGMQRHVVIPEGVTKISRSAFLRQEQLVSVHIPQTVTAIDEQAFCDCSSLTEINLPEGMTVIENMTFAGCKSLERLTLPEGLISIGPWAFSGCSKLAEVTIPSSVTEIDSWAFYDCNSLTSIVIPEGIQSIGNAAFSDCVNLTSVTMPKGFTATGHRIFDGCKRLYNEEGFVIIGNVLYQGDIQDPHVIIPDGVTALSNSALSLCNSLVSVTIPKGVTFIGDAAFYMCRNLSSLSIAEGVTHIGTGAFGYCKNLTSLSLPESVQTLPASFVDVNDIRQLIVPGIVPRVFTEKQVRLAAAAGFLTSPELYKAPGIPEAYEDLILSLKDELLPMVFSRDLVHGIAYYAAAGHITPQNYNQSYLQPALAANAHQCVAFLLDWENKNLPARDLAEEWETELDPDPFAATEMGKLWSWVTNPNGSVCITEYRGREQRITIPHRIGNAPVTGIGEMTFNPKKQSQTTEQRVFFLMVQSIEIPPSITYIGSCAFLEKHQLLVTAGSYAECYAKEHKLRFTVLASP